MRTNKQVNMLPQQTKKLPQLERLSRKDQQEGLVTRMSGTQQWSSTNLYEWSSAVGSHNKDKQKIGQED